jgi:hypothetical protein
MSEVEGWEVDWCRVLWDSLRDRGVWGIPRSGLVFQKFEAEREFRVIARMPHEEGMPLSASELREQQQTEIEGNRARFTEFGVQVTDATGGDGDAA